MSSSRWRGHYPFSWDKYKPGRALETSDKLIENTGMLDEYSTQEEIPRSNYDNLKMQDHGLDTLVRENGDGFIVVRGDTTKDGKYRHVYRAVLKNGKPIEEK